uniref:Uncharacterized protein n=1 Tax=Neospora caninum (strain Liverpool) TaxID=572307 RepID=A0A0F7UAV4_NEOCL|nr:TPA: hypothetical protein BN1204_019505 [Neospora caninum Liverpool]
MGRTKATMERAKCVSGSDSSDSFAPVPGFVNEGKELTRRKKGPVSETALCTVEEVFLPPVSRESLLTLNPFTEIENIYRQMANNLEKAIDRAQRSGMPKKATVSFVEVEQVATAARARLKSKRDNVAMRFSEAGQQMRVLKSKLNRLDQHITEAVSNARTTCPELRLVNALHVRKKNTPRLLHGPPLMSRLRLRLRSNN